MTETSNTEIINPAQATSVVGTIIKVIGGVLAYMGLHLSPSLEGALAGPEALQFYSGLFMVGAPMAYDWFVHSRKGKLAAVEAMPGVAQVLIKPTASPDLIAMVKDDVNHPKVQSAVEPMAMRYMKATDP